MKEEDFHYICDEVNYLKEQITLIDNNYNDLNHSNDIIYNNVIYDVNERISNLEKKIDEIYSILFNAKRLNLSDLNN